MVPWRGFIISRVTCSNQLVQSRRYISCLVTSACTLARLMVLELMVVQVFLKGAQSITMHCLGFILEGVHNCRGTFRYAGLLEALGSYQWSGVRLR